VKRVLITGSGGFVGRILGASLVADGFDVVGADLEATSDPIDTRACNLENQADLGRLLDDVAPEWIVHLAAQSSAGRSFDEPHATIRNNLLPALHLLDYLREHGSKARLLVVGSADVYGAVPKEALPIAESQLPRPANPYALSKWLQEETCRQYASLYGIDVVMTRSFNHTGAGQRDTFVLPSFARQIAEIRLGRRDARVEVGNIEIERDFSDVRDVCRAYRQLLEAGRTGVIYNVCSGTSHSLRTLLEKLAALAGVEIDIVVDEKRVRPVDMEVLRGDHSLLTRDTGWQPAIPIEDTLQSLLDYWAVELAQ
jgi:GDP-4-dehydro-6-deoxy-D-mannose reductase